MAVSKIQVIDGEGNGPAAIDKKTNALVQVEHVVHDLHEGVMFYRDYPNAAMADTDVIEMLISVPATEKSIHAVVGGASTGEVTFEFFEGTSTSNDGTVITGFNRHRESGNSPEVVVTHTPTVSDAGTLLQTKYFGAAGVVAQQGDDIRGVNEWILKSNMKYLLRLTAHDALKGRLYINWTEEE